MAYNHQHSQSNVPYDPLPGSSNFAEHIEMRHSPSPAHSPLIRDRDFAPSPSSTPRLPNIDDLPPGAAVPTPRFYGLALRDEGPRPFDRNSYASSIGTSSSTQYDPLRTSYDQSSIHALKPSTEDVTSYLHRGSSPMMEEASYSDDPYAAPSYFPPMQHSPPSRRLEEKRNYYASPQQKSRKRGLLIGGIITGIILLIVLVMVPLYFTVIKKHLSGTSGAAKGDGDGDSNGSNGSPNNPATAAIITGGDGSTVTLEDGSAFTYSNKFGGYWVDDPTDPFNNGARAQSWSPALNETFNWGVDKIRGVNLGGWLVTEPFIVPALYEKYYNASKPVDEWMLSEAMTAANAMDDLRNHYRTFITEEDFAQIAGAGLNFVRIPIAYWAIETRPGEPFLAQESWPYFLKAIKWARKYGLRINLDLHAVPGSQNGWNHSGRLGSINWLYGVPGVFNAQRTLEYVRVITQFISQPQYRDVVTMFGIINEPRASPYIGNENLARWYYEAYHIIRNITGIGEGNGPFVSIHDGFSSPSNWAPIFPNADRVALDTHPYIAFGDHQSTSPPSAFLATPCNNWGNMMNNSMGAFGLTAAGEFSLGINDCGLWVNGVDQGTRYEGDYIGGSAGAVGSCSSWNDWTKWNASLKKGFMGFALSSMDALQNYFFWTWKIGNSSITGKVEAPMWSYKLGLENGWLPLDPRDALGACDNQGASGNTFQAPLKAWQTGGTGAGNIPASVSNQYAWPPTFIQAATDVSLLPSYTATGVNPTLSAPTATSSSATGTFSFGNGWLNPQDTQGAYVEISGCHYPDPWGGTSIPIPDSPACTGGVKREVFAAPGPTPHPR